MLYMHLTQLYFFIQRSIYHHFNPNVLTWPVQLGEIWSDQIWHSSPYKYWIENAADSDFLIVSNASM